MATGWAPDGAVQEQIDASIEDAVQQARNNLQQGESLQYCEECGEEIPEARRKARPGVRLCLDCQAEREQQQQSAAAVNRRGSKDSQLR